MSFATVFAADSRFARRVSTRPVHRAIATTAPMIVMTTVIAPTMNNQNRASRFSM